MRDDNGVRVYQTGARFGQEMADRKKRANDFGYGHPDYGTVRGKCFVWFLLNYPDHCWANVHGPGVTDNVWHYMRSEHPDVVEATREGVKS